MASGYTMKLYDGEDQSFEEFLLACARAFCHVELRDEPLGPIPDDPHDSSDVVRYADEVAKAEKELQGIRQLTFHEASVKAGADFRERLEDWARQEKKRQQIATRYTKMLSKVEAWEPPSADHEALKEFMIEQLEDSLKFDCRPCPRPELVHPDEWIKQQIERAEHSVSFYKRQYEQAKELNEHNNRWKRQLLESIGRKMQHA